MPSPATRPPATPPTNTPPLPRNALLHVAPRASRKRVLSAKMIAAKQTEATKKIVTETNRKFNKSPAATTVKSKEGVQGNATASRAKQIQGRNTTNARLLPKNLTTPEILALCTTEHAKTMHVVTARVVVNGEYLKRESSGQAKVKKARCFNLNWGDSKKWITNFESPAKEEAMAKLRASESGKGKKRKQPDPSNIEDPHEGDIISENEASDVDEDEAVVPVHLAVTSTTSATTTATTTSAAAAVNSIHPWASLNLNKAVVKGGPVLVGSGVFNRRVIGVKVSEGGGGRNPRDIARMLVEKGREEEMVPPSKETWKAVDSRSFVGMVSAIQKPSLPPPEKSFLVELAAKVEEERQMRYKSTKMVTKIASDVGGDIDGEDGDDGDDGDDGEDGEDGEDVEMEDNFDQLNSALKSIKENGEMLANGIKKSLHEEFGEGATPRKAPQEEVSSPLVEEIKASAGSASVHTDNLPSEVVGVLLNGYQRMTKADMDDGSAARRDAQYSSAVSTARNMRRLQFENFRGNEREKDVLKMVEQVLEKFKKR